MRLDELTAQVAGGITLTDLLYLRKASGADPNKKMTFNEFAAALAADTRTLTNKTISTGSSVAGSVDLGASTDPITDLWATALNGGPVVTQRNYVINPSFQFWMRGTGAFTTTGYTADCWKLTVGTGATVSVSRGSPVDALTARYSMSFGRTVAGSSSSILNTFVEDVRTLAGKTAVLSFDAISDSGASQAVTVNLYQKFGTGGSPSSDVLAGTSVVTVTTTATRHYVTFTVPSISGKTIGSNVDDRLELQFERLSASGTGTIRISNVQLEHGARPSTFAEPDIGTEQLKVWRYLYVIRETTAAMPFCVLQNAVAGGNTTYGMVRYPVQMRTTPSFATLLTSTDFNIQTISVGGTQVSSLTATLDEYGGILTATIAGVLGAVNVMYYLVGRSSGSALIFTAEY